MFRQLFCGPLLVLLCTFSAAQEPSAPTPIKVDIDAQRLDKALNVWARQTGFSVMISVERAAQGRIAPKVVGTYTPEEALKLLLAPTDLVYEFIDARTVAVRPTRAKPQAGLTSSSELRLSEVGQRDAGQKINQTAAIGGSAPQRSEHQSSTDEGDDSKAAIPEVIVTAQKRSERLLDVPVPVTSLDTNALAASNQLRAVDYYARVPGLSLTAGFGNPTLTIRGLAAGGGPTVGIIVDEVPYGSNTTLGGGGFGTPDLDPSELARIEVLRGPQGTLYGASSLGGLLKYVTVDPSTSGFSGRVQVGSSVVRNGEEAGYNARGAVNIPINDSLALRISGFRRRDPGYIDNVQAGQDAINFTDAMGGRLAALWKISEDYTLRLSALYQDRTLHGFPFIHVQPGVGDLEQSTLRGSGRSNLKSEVYSATLDGKIGNADLTLISGYNVGVDNDKYDFTYSFGPRVRATYLDNTLGDMAVQYNRARRFTQEVRANIPMGTKVEWLIGGFYTDARSYFDVSNYAVDPANGAWIAQFLDNPFDTTYEEYAAFTNLTYRFTDRFDVQFGARGGETRQSYSTIWTGPYVTRYLLVSDPLVPPPARTNDNVFTHLVTPRLKLMPNMMVFARLASGYRPGGPNSNSSRNELPTYGPDKTQNYELGFKGEVLPDGLLTLDASVFYIDWRDIQLTVTDPTTRAAIFLNAGRAKSQGTEITLESRPWKGMTAALWGSYNDAALTEDFPSSSFVAGHSGDRLPVSSRLSGGVSLEQRFRLGFATASVGAVLSYVGERLGAFTVAGAQRQIFPAYAKTDVNAGIEWNSWQFDVFINNVTDRRGLLFGGSSNPTAYNVIVPRSLGASITKAF